MRSSILRGWKAIVEHGYAAVYQDCRGRHGSEGEDRVYADDANDAFASSYRAGRSNGVRRASVWPR